jgi:hypothetical protein
MQTGMAPKPWPLWKTPIDATQKDRRSTKGMNFAQEIKRPVSSSPDPV